MKKKLESGKQRQPILHEKVNQPIFAPTQPALLPPQINGTLTRRLNQLNEENRPRPSGRNASINPDVINPSHETLAELYELQPYEMRKLKKFFNQFSGKDRKMNFHEFVKLYGNLNPGLRGLDIVNIAEQAFFASDTNDDGLLSFNEFLIAYCLTKPKRSFAGFPGLYKSENEHNFTDKFNTVNGKKALNMLPYYPSNKESDEGLSENYSHDDELEASQTVDSYEKKISSQVQQFNSNTQALVDQQSYQSEHQAYQQQSPQLNQYQPPQYERPQSQYMESTIPVNNFAYHKTQLNDSLQYLQQPTQNPEYLTPPSQIQAQLHAQSYQTQSHDQQTHAVQKYVQPPQYMQSIQPYPHLKPVIPNERDINMNYPNYEQQTQYKTLPSMQTSPPPPPPPPPPQIPQQPPYRYQYDNQSRSQYEQQPQYNPQPQSQQQQLQYQYDNQSRSQYEQQPQYSPQPQPQSQQQQPQYQYDHQLQSTMFQNQ